MWGFGPTFNFKEKNMSSDQKFSTLTADGNFKTITGGSTNIGPCRVTYIQAHGGTNCLVKLHD